MKTAEIIERHRSAGREFQAAGVRSRVWEQGEGEAVLCIHGVPTSAFLYRKLLGELASRGLRGVAFDLPGMGLAERPEYFDYSWTGLGRFSLAAAEALGLERYHLVVHDIGGPIGFELAAAAPERVASLTILNTMIEVDSFKRPWSMEPFARRGIGEVYLRATPAFAFRVLLRLQAIEDTDSISREEMNAYLKLLRMGDGGRAFLRIMRGFERTAEKSRLYASAVREVPYPVQLIWGDRDPALPISDHGESLKRVTGVDAIHRLPAKHFLQEDQAPAIAELIARLAGSDPR